MGSLLFENIQEKDLLIESITIGTLGIGPVIDSERGHVGNMRWFY